MKLAIQEILLYVLDHPEVTTVDAVISYFYQFFWSIEKQEWDGLTDQEKQQFPNQIDVQNSGRQKGSETGENKPPR